MNHRAAGTDVGERHLIGPQTSGRHYRNLSEVGYRLIRDDDVERTVHAALRRAERTEACVPFTATEGARMHIEAMAPSLVAQRISDWLDDTLASQD